MENGAPAGLRAPRYTGEDTRETTEREIRGFYCYSAAAEVFAVCGVGKVYFSLLQLYILTLANHHSKVHSSQ